MLFFHLNREEITELVGRKTLAAKYRTNLLNQHVASLLEDMCSHYYYSTASWSQQIKQIWLNEFLFNFFST